MAWDSVKQMPEGEMENIMKNKESFVNAVTYIANKKNNKGKNHIETYFFHISAVKKSGIFSFFT